MFLSFIINLLIRWYRVRYKAVTPISLWKNVVGLFLLFEIISRTILSTQKIFLKFKRGKCGLVWLLYQQNTLFRTITSLKHKTICDLDEGQNVKAINHICMDFITTCRSYQTNMMALMMFFMIWRTLSPPLIVVFNLI